MLRFRNLADVNRKRTIKPLHTHTQGYPFPARLDEGFDRTQGQLAGAGAVTGSQAAILPGAVMVKSAGDTVTLAGAGTTDRPFGLAAQFVGGDLDELHSEDGLGVWRGAGSTFLLRAPAFNDTGLAAAATAEDGAAANEVYMIAGADGRLVYDAAAGPSSLSAGGSTKLAVARLVKRHSASAIEIELLV